MADEEVKVKWYQKSWLMWVCLVLFPPIGLILLFLSRERHPRWKVIAAVGLVWCFIAYSSGHNSNKENPAPAQQASQSESAQKQDSKAAEKPSKDNKKEQSTNYTQVSLSDMMNDLEGNAAAAQKKYKGKNVQVVNGTVDNIDSDGDYFTLKSPDHPYAITSIQCFLHDKKLKEAVLNIRKGDPVIVRGKVSDVGELMGYSLDTASFEVAR